MKMFLFDIDGTLILTGGAGDRALDRAFFELYKIPHAMDLVRPAGKTDPAIVREIFHEKFGRDCSADEMKQICKKYLEALADEVRTSPGYHVLPGMTDILKRLSAMPDCLLGIITGNLAEGAPIKLGRGDLNRYFRFGGYGSDSEDRAELTRIGIERGRKLQKVPSLNDQIYLLGDTPLDIAAGRKNGVVMISVATGPWPYEDLKTHHPDFLFKDLSDTGAFLRAVGL